MQNIVRAIRDCDSSIKVAATGYADALRVGSVNPMLVPEIASKAEADVAMIDTAVKDGRSLFTFLNVSQLGRFVDAAHDQGLLAALAGCLKKEDLPKIYDLGADVVGLRGAACVGGDRVNGRISREKVRVLVETVRRLEKH